jgi:nucleoside-diphosphate-sugar epimerase
LKVFVTGGTGFIGSHLVDALLARGDEVVCLTRNPTNAKRIFADRPVEIVQGNLQDAQALAAGCTGADAVFHLAGLVAARNRAEFFAVNGSATRTLVSVAHRAAPSLRHFIYVSSVAAAGPSAKGQALSESVRTQPVTDYGWSKLAGEEAVRASQLPWTIVRPPAVYGPRDTEVFKLFKFARRGLVPLFGDGSQELSLVYAPDLAAALIACLTTQAVERVFFACHRDVHTARQFGSAVYAAVAESDEKRRAPRFITIPPPAARVALWITGTAAKLARRATILSANKANEFLAEAWTCSPDAIERATGWRASTALATGIDHTARWYREAGWL